MNNALDRMLLQKMYVDQVGMRLEGYKVQSHSPFRANFRCPICGDSKSKKHLKRGYLLEKSEGMLFHCHNECGTIGFERLLREYYPDIYSEYRFNLLRGNFNSSAYEAVEVVEEEPTVEVPDVNLPRAIDNSKILKYINDRQIPEWYHSELYYAHKFKGFINTIEPGRFSERVAERVDERLVMPMRFYNGEIYGLIGRAMDSNNDPKYLTIKFDDDKPKMFGLERINLLKESRVVEGPIDSLFIDNCCAMAGTDGDPMRIFRDTSAFVMILDNQPRSTSVIKKYEKYINLGMRVMLWPEDIPYKDINDCILGGISKEELEKIIVENTRSGLDLKIRFRKWKRV